MRKLFMNKKILAIVGLCGSGKSVIADYFISNGYKKVYFGGITLEEVKRKGLDINEKNEKMVREELRRQYGMGAYAILSLDKITGFLKNGKNVLIDGLYSWSEYKILKEKFKDLLYLIAVFTPRHLRYKRLSTRKERPLSATEAQSRDFAEIENLEKGGPIAISDITLINDSSIEELINQLKKKIEIN